MIFVYHEIEARRVVFTAKERPDSTPIGKLAQMPESRLEFVADSLLRRINPNAEQGLSVVVEDPTD